MSAARSTTSSGSGATPSGTSSPKAPRSLIHAGAAGLANALVAVALAPRCAACATVLDTPLAGAVCETCWRGVRQVAPPACRICGQPLPSWRTLSLATELCAPCRRNPPAYDAGVVACDYEGPIRAIIHAFKYDGRRSLAKPLGALLRGAAAAVLADAHLVVPVPLHPWKRLRRGFNQASDLAAQLDAPVAPLLWRRRATAPQAGLTPRERRGNVRDAFIVSPLLRSTRRDAAIAGRTIVLVDDIVTTGATLDACARALKGAGARQVRTLTLARAVLRPKS